MMDIEKADPHFYQPPREELWQGRPAAPELGVQFWYQRAKRQHVDDYFADSSKKADVAIIGLACDEGVRRNLGRVGAALAPAKIRQLLAPIACHTDQYIVDLGDVRCYRGDLETAHEWFTEFTARLVGDGSFTVGIGGGHDLSYAHFCGITKGLGTASKTLIINLDAHLDLRPLKKYRNSGTPFNQILTEFGSQVTYLVLGVQQASNSPRLFGLAKDFDVNYLDHMDYTLPKWEIVAEWLQPFLETHDHVYLTVDMDGFASPFAPGVSAPSPMGFEPHIVLETLRLVKSSGKLVAFDVVETNPNYDIDNHTSRLAARVIDWIVRH